MAIIDVHTHMFTPRYMELLKVRGGDYNLKTRPDGQVEVYRRDTPVVLPQKGHFDYGLRLRDMDAAGIDMAIVSLTCPNVFWGGEAVSREAARESNAAMAAARETWPDRIGWLASLPWEYPPAAADELKRSHDAGAAGVMVLANIAGASLTDPRFESVWAEIERLSLPVLVHPTDLPGIEAMNMRDYDLSWSVGFIADTTLAFARMIFDGFLDRYPGLSLIASHGGGALPYIVGRMDKGDEVEIPARRRMTARPSEYLKRIWYDSITYDLGALQYLIEVVGADRVMLGTDYPHQVHDMTGAIANTAALPTAQRASLREANARSLFKL